MTREEKIQLAKELEDRLQNVQGIIFTDYRGLDVEQISSLRNELRQADVYYQVVKNRIMWRAISGTIDGEKLKEQLFVGPTAVAFSSQEPITAAKIIKNFAKENDQLEIKGGFLDNKALDKAAVLHLASLPGKKELLAMLLAGMQAPVTGFVRTLGGVIPKFVRTLDAIRQQKEVQTSS